ncbi:hypothetical protein OHV05_38100 (plasmid) [Kitasatospora sp. NBC_00070]|uniref:hypothetical protein n=1 Tax=Kitasatospora sp. NBC_00070 TaxID=2975962 RepID=UPI002F90F31D
MPKLIPGWLARLHHSGPLGHGPHGDVAAVARQRTLRDAADWAIVVNRRDHGPDRPVTVADVQLRAWEDFNLSVSAEDAAAELRRRCG